jgi:hypothetical protein
MLTFIALLVFICVRAHAFQIHSKLNHARSHTLSRHLHNSVAMNSDPSEDVPPTSMIPQSPIILSPAQYFMSPTMDVPSLLTILIGQTGLIVGVFALEIFTGYGVIPPWGSFSFTPQALTIVGALSIPLFLAGVAFYSSGWDFAKQIERNSRVFSLRLLGRSTPPVATAFSALLLSVVAGNMLN